MSLDGRMESDEKKLWREGGKRMGEEDEKDEANGRKQADFAQKGRIEPHVTCRVAMLAPVDVSNVTTSSN